MELKLTPKIANFEPKIFSPKIDQKSILYSKLCLRLISESLKWLKNSFFSVIAMHAGKNWKKKLTRARSATLYFVSIVISFYMNLFKFVLLVINFVD